MGYIKETYECKLEDNSDHFEIWLREASYREWCMRAKKRHMRVGYTWEQEKKTLKRDIERHMRVRDTSEWETHMRVRNTWIIDMWESWTQSTTLSC
jgi:hypothetical protein